MSRVFSQTSIPGDDPDLMLAMSDQTTVIIPLLNIETRLPTSILTSAPANSYRSEEFYNSTQIVKVYNF
jgi:hypothetical protein